MDRYYVENKQNTILNHCYCYVESMNILFNRKLISSDRNHKKVRN